MTTTKLFSTKKSLLNENADHPLQTWEWGEFRKAWGNEVVETRFGILTLHKIPFTNYKIGVFFKGPMPTQEMIEDLKNLGKKEDLIFIKLEPNYVVKKDEMRCADKEKAVNLLKKNGAVLGKTLFTPTTFWINLTRSEEELIKSFSSKTRYNIRVAQRNGVTAKEDNSSKAFEKYLELTRETVNRQGFYAHTEKYHRLMWKFLQPPGIAHLLTAIYKNQIITTWILFTHKDFLYYPYGASSDKDKSVMANNLMMWEAIKFGKKLGLKTFDLWGREPEKGFTKFKEGYNPQVVEFLGTWDLVINIPLYYLYRIAENLRWSFLKTKAKLNFTKQNF